MKDAGLRRDFELTSVKMRAMEMILARPGADWAKVRRRSRRCSLLVSRALRGLQLCMLVAGPDWLTSILAGMHNTNVWRILATQMAPTTLLIAGPATIAGAFQLRVPEGDAWLAVSSLLLFFAAACQARAAVADSLRPAAQPLTCSAAQGIGIVLFYYRIMDTAAKHEEELKVCNAHPRCAHQLRPRLVLSMRFAGQAERPRGGGAA